MTRSANERLAELEAENEALRREVEECHQAKEDLRLGEQRHRSLVEAITAIVWNTPASGEFETEQPRWSAFTGQTFDELKGWGWLNAVHPDDRPNTARVWSAAVATRSPYEVEHRLRRHDGTYHHMLVRAVPILDDEGPIREWVGVHTDVTAQKEAEAALREATLLAEAANRAKGDFLANMSHEIRTPMNGILGMTELALGTELTPEQRRYLGLVKTSADSLLTIINDLLDFSKIEAGKFELDAIPFALRDRVGDTMKALALRAHKKGLEVACSFDPDVPDALVGDPGRLGQVLINLVGNAIKFTATGEVVLTVRCAEDEMSSDARVVLLFKVSDTGPGIPADKQCRLFQPFSQADTSTTRQFGGTGLGLTIARGLVDLMGGRIWFESEPGRGSTFSFTAAFETQSPGCQSADAEPDRLRGTSALIVDDNATNRLLLRELLMRWGMMPSLAASAPAALEVLSEAAALGTPFDLVLSDVMMPEVDGYQLAERIRQRPELDGAAVILLSSADTQHDTARCRLARVSAYLTKPVKQSELLDAILRALDPCNQQAEAIARERRPRSVDPCRSRPLDVLLVEDNATNQLLAVALLEKEGHRVETVNNGREALEILSGRSFDVVLMDIQMPVMDGFETTSRIREWEKQTGAHVPIVAMTAHALKGDRERCLAAGMDGYVSKPVHADELYRALARCGPGSSPEQESLSDAREGPPPVTIDREALLARVGGREDRLRKIVQVFLDESSRLMAELQGAIAERDAPAVKENAHALKGAVGIFGVPGLVEAAQAIESLGQSGDLAGAEETYRQLKEEVGALRSALTETLSPATAGRPRLS
jgi:PAS domain S-box-containing protein